MTQPPNSRRILRSILAVFAGLLVVVIPSVLADKAVYAAGIFPPRAEALWLIPTTYRFVFAVAGCFLAARLAPRRPMLHSWILGTIGIAAGIVGVVVWFTKGPEIGPLWYAAAVFAMPIPCAWAGGKLGQPKPVAPLRA